MGARLWGWGLVPVQKHADETPACQWAGMNMKRWEEEERCPEEEEEGKWEKTGRGGEGIERTRAVEMRGKTKERERRIKRGGGCLKFTANLMQLQKVKSNVKSDIWRVGNVRLRAEGLEGSRTDSFKPEGNVVSNLPQNTRLWTVGGDTRRCKLHTDNLRIVGRV